MVGHIQLYTRIHALKERQRAHKNCRAVDARRYRSLEVTSAGTALVGSFPNRSCGLELPDSGDAHLSTLHTWVVIVRVPRLADVPHAIGRMVATRQEPIQAYWMLSPMIGVAPDNW